MGLPVSHEHELGFGALGRDIRKRLDRGGYTRIARSLWLHVIANSSWIRNALAAEAAIYTQLLLDSICIAECRTYDRADVTHIR